MQMNYAVVGTNDLEAAAAFYDALFEGSEVMQLRPSDRMIYWLGAGFAFAVARPFDGNPAMSGNGTMVGFSVGSDAEVTRLHALAIARGGTCDGQPGRKGPRFSGYVRDLDGNKICLSD